MAIFTPPDGQYIIENSFETVAAWTLDPGATLITSAMRSGAASVEIAAADDSNLLLDPGHELGDVWTYTGFGEQSSTEVYEGDYSCRLRTRNGFGGNQESDTWQYLSVDSDTSYTFSCYTNSDAAINVECQIYYDPGTGVWNLLRALAHDDFTGWAHISDPTVLSFDTITAGAPLTGGIRIVSQASLIPIIVDDWYVDNCMLTRQTGRATQVTSQTASAGDRVYASAFANLVSGTGKIMLEVFEGTESKGAVTLDETGQIKWIDRDPVFNLTTELYTASADPRLTWQHFGFSFLASGTGALTIRLQGTGGTSTWRIDDVSLASNPVEIPVTWPENGRSPINWQRSYIDSIQGDGLRYESEFERTPNGELRRGLDLDQPSRDDYPPRSPREPTV